MASSRVRAVSARASSARASAAAARWPALLGVLAVPLGLLACLVPVGFGRADEGLGVGTDLAGQVLGLALGVSDPGLGGAHCGVGVGLGPPDRLGGLRLRLLDGERGMGRGLHCVR